MAEFAVRIPSGTYPAVIERGILRRVREWLPPHHDKLFVLTEKRIWHAHGSSLAGFDQHVYFLQGGEENKRLAPLERAADWMLECGADRSSVVLAFGGGIVNDMAGFLAAMFMRGVQVVQMPTTLLAQVDASVGGKTGVNLRGGKNLIGSFHQPLATLIDPGVLTTLPEREYRAGLWEVIKTAVIASPPLFHLLRDSRAAVLARANSTVDQMITECVRIKAEVCSQDERETGLRRILNFGHTIGHALEAETGYSRYLHGEAVGLGMRGATHLAHESGRISETDAREILDLIESYAPSKGDPDIAPESILARLGSDKKTRGGQVHFVLPTGVGSVEVASGLPAERILAAIRYALR